MILPPRERTVTNSSTLFRNPCDGQSSPTISIVIPAYCEEGNLAKLCEELIQSLASMAVTWEVIIVDDGSTDNTWNEITALHEEDSRIKGLRLSRNFGHQYALFAGLSSAAGEAIISMDSDLQHPPAVIGELLEQWHKGSKIVHTIRVDYPSITWMKKISSRIFSRIFTSLSGVELSRGMGDFRLLDRQVVDDVIQLKEGGLFLRGLIQWMGYPSSKVRFQCRDRLYGESKFPLIKLLKYAWRGITSFSLIPLRLAIILGLITSLIAFSQLGYAVWAKLFTDSTVPGWATIVSIISLLFGILFILLGVIGEYIGHILEEVRGRPRFIISERIGFALADANHGTVQLPTPVQSMHFE